MVVAVDGPFEGRTPGRRALELLPAGLVSYARRPPSEVAAPEDPAREVTAREVTAREEGSERVLRAAVEALLGLARRTPGFDVTVTVNQAGGPGAGQARAPAVRLHYTEEGLVAHRLTPRGRVAGREEVGPVFDESHVVSELASMLRSGEVEPR